VAGLVAQIASKCGKIGRFGLINQPILIKNQKRDFSHGCTGVSGISVLYSAHFRRR